MTTPVRVVAPVPPPPTGSVPYSRSVPPELTLSGCPAVPLAKRSSFVPLSFRISPAALEVEVNVLSVVLIVLLVRMRVSVVPTNSPARETRLRKESFDNPKSGV
jgi:hypothetical protein